jgi:hypothetical protein
MNAIFNGFPANTACEIAKTNWPLQMELQFAAPFRRGLKELDKREARKAARAAYKAKPSPTASNGAGSATGVAPLPESQIETLDASTIRELLRNQPLPAGRNGDAELNIGKRPDQAAGNRPETIARLAYNLLRFESMGGAADAMTAAEALGV